ncbi:GNAT family N-acetyltransferase [Lactobacillus johnsonii]|uniref:GNAT family N-acetyltransferase n=1 Tax=Lactobacillus johnsonii TaxID=33959 RepID=UPI0028EE1901|nr:GNAT family N-acetyltransferase [Lactobacillus johnsonii]MDT9605790.1 GNAT family N-acetyltransferase [Lactobacillus johnsonii]
MSLEIKSYEQKYFNELCLVMDRARKQELQSEDLEDVFLPLRDAPYLDYFLSCKIYVAFEDGVLAGFVGFRPKELSFIYVDPTYQNRGIATELIKKALIEVDRPVRLEVFTDNERAKALYSKFGFERVDTIIEKWSDEFPIVFSQDTMELR